MQVRVQNQMRVIVYAGECLGVAQLHAHVELVHILLVGGGPPNSSLCALCEHMTPARQGAPPPCNMVLTFGFHRFDIQAVHLCNFGL